MRLRWRWFQSDLHGQHPNEMMSVIVKPGYGCWVLSDFNIHPRTMEQFPAEVSSISEARRIGRLIILTELERIKNHPRIKERGKR